MRRAPPPHCPLAESNWRKARGLLRHPRLAGLPRVQLPREVSASGRSRRHAGTPRPTL